MGCSSREIPSSSEKPAPRPKITMATIRDQKYSSLPWPKGCSSSGGRRLLRIPNSKSNSLHESAVAWKASASIAGLLVIAAAAYLKRAIAMLAAIATYRTFVEERLALTLSALLPQAIALSRFFPRHFGAFLSCFRQADRNGLLTALYGAALSATAGLQSSLLLSTHRTLN